MTASQEDNTPAAPFRVAEIPGAGRGLVATRNITAGETVLSCEAAVRGPCAVSGAGGGAGAQCVNCLKLVQPGASRQCSKCCLSVCSELCQKGSDHAVECAILSLIRTKLRRNQQGEKMYRNNLSGLTAAITTLRMVSLKWRDPPAWNLISTLMAENFNQAVWQDIARVYDNILSLDPRILLSDLKHAFGIQSTNGALLHLPPGYGRGLAVYPMQALLNHSCMCNTVSQDYPQEGLVQIKARFNIPAGEEITTSYMRPTQDTQARRQLLAHTWHFWCQCARCQDNTEGGTFLSAIVCTACGVGPLLPQHPLDPQSSWTCQTCQAAISHEEQETLLQRSLQIINSFPKENLTSHQLEEMIFQLSKILSPSHWLMMEIQQKLLNVYLTTKNLNRPLKERKIQLCEIVSDYMEKMDPGNKNSQRKLQIMMSRVDTEIELLSSDYRNGVSCKDKLASAFLVKKDLLQLLKS